VGAPQSGYEAINQLSEYYVGKDASTNFSKAEIVVFGNAVLPYRLLYI
jgi:hypothetical protein